MSTLRFTVFAFTICFASFSMAQERHIGTDWTESNREVTHQGVESMGAVKQASGFRWDRHDPAYPAFQPEALAQPEPRPMEIRVASRFDDVNNAEEQPEFIDFHLKASRASDLSLDKPKKSHPVINWDVYRNSGQRPIDPRHACTECVRPPSRGPFTKFDLPGLFGRPNTDREPGGCTCNKKYASCKCSMFSQYWPRPFSAKLDEKFPNRAAARYAPCQKARIVDVFDRLENFQLIRYHRVDNGQCGDRWGCNDDPYGCLGESKYLSEIVPGVGYRDPGSPLSKVNLLEQPTSTLEWDEDSVPAQNAGYPILDKRTPSHRGPQQAPNFEPFEPYQPEPASTEKLPIRDRIGMKVSEFFNR